jgi:hypothetical protein
MFAASNTETATQPHLGMATVKTHIGRLLAKLHEPQHVRHREPVVQRLVLGQERDPRQRLASARPLAEHRNVPLVRRQQADDHM